MKRSCYRSFNGRAHAPPVPCADTNGWANPLLPGVGRTSSIHRKTVTRSARLPGSSRCTCVMSPPRSAPCRYLTISLCTSGGGALQLALDVSEQAQLVALAGRQATEPLATCSGSSVAASEQATWNTPSSSLMAVQHTLGFVVSCIDSSSRSPSSAPSCLAPPSLPAGSARLRSQVSTTVNGFRGERESEIDRQEWTPQHDVQPWDIARARGLRRLGVRALVLLGI